MNRLGSSTSPYLLLHADNPVDWWPWSAEAFAEAKRRDVPVMVSIGYATCHWCHVMARESFSDPLTAARINERFVAIKVDREEHPDVDASYLAAAGAFTRQLGWPLTVFTTPDGLAFFAGTYFPPTPVGGMASFTQVLDAVTEAWSERRDQVTGQAAAIGEALTAAAARERPDDALPGVAELDAAAVALAGHEDTEFGGFGTAPKFPVAPVLGFLLAGDADARALAARTLERMGASALRDSVEGGFFRYATRRDWTDPHYERMLYDNALLLDDYVRAGLQTPSLWSRVVSEAVAGFLIEVMQLPDGGFASAQDSESTIGGDRSEGGYYRLDAEARSRETPPALDRKVLSGWNGLAVGALAGAGAAFDRPEWIAAAARAADRLLATHVRGDRLVRSSLDGRVSPAKATLEDFGMLAGGLAALATASGEVRFAVAARTLVEMTMEAGAGAGTAAGLPFAVPGGADDVLVAQGVALGVDASEGAYPSGWTATADAAHRLFLLTGDRRMLAAAEGAMRSIAVEALANPIAYGGALALMRRLADPVTQLVVVVPDAAGSDDSDELPAAARARPSSVTAIVTEEQARTFAEAGFELFEGRVSLGGEATAYLCTDFVCRLPVTSAAAL